MYLGRFTLGQYVPLAVLTLGNGYGAAWPAIVPTFAVYQGSGLRVTAGRLPPADLGRQPGSFCFLLRLGSGFTAGVHTAVLDWALDGLNRREVNRFEIVGGGDVNGSVISMHAYRRPHADFLVQKLDSFQRSIQRNPE